LVQLLVVVVVVSLEHQQPVGQHPLVSVEQHQQQHPQ
jgi:hypothetical protein